MQLRDFLFIFLHPQYPLLVDIDWSAVHSEHREGALDAKDMGVKYGGAHPKMRATTVERAEGVWDPIRL